MLEEAVDSLITVELQKLRNEFGNSIINEELLHMQLLNCSRLLKKLISTEVDNKEMASRVACKVT